MFLLVVLLILFTAVHVIPAIPRARAAARSALGRAYGAVYGTASLVLLVACIWAMRNAGGDNLYDPPLWGRHANFLLTLIAFIFVGIFLARGSWRNTLRYPMAIAVMFWALGHLLANGEARTVIFIAGLAFAALLHAFLASRLTVREPGVERQGHNFMSVLFGVALYALMAQLHGVVVGVPVIDLASFSR
ncbi:MAG: hypothetical protein JNM45_12545 [Rhizobiales bacterium]|nr:hypothetical protein [Hyphomicrobiales bacterium]